MHVYPRMLYSLATPLNSVILTEPRTEGSEASRSGRTPVMRPSAMLIQGVLLFPLSLAFVCSA
jgi:hypothetical protein